MVGLRGPGKARSWLPDAESVLVPAINALPPKGFDGMSDACELRTRCQPRRYFTRLTRTMGSDIIASGAAAFEECVAWRERMLALKTLLVRQRRAASHDHDDQCALPDARGGQALHGW